MTLIAFHVEPDHVEILSDSLTYEKSGRSMGTTTKVDVFPHLDTAVLAQGDGNLARMWRAEMHLLDDAADFDELDELTQDRLPEVCDELEDQRPLAFDTVIFHVGWSPARGRFVAYGYPSAFDFERHDFTDEFFCYPAPTSGEPAPPASVEQWVDLAKQLRRERALAPMGAGIGKVFVGGAVLLTRVERGVIATRRVHTFDDAGDEFAEMVDGTAHPVYQRSACLCGSGYAVAACGCWDKTIACLCGSQEPLEACCLLDADDCPTYPPAKRASADPAPPVKVGRNQPCPCGSGRKHKKCCGAAVPA